MGFLTYRLAAKDVKKISTKVLWKAYYLSNNTYQIFPRIFMQTNLTMAVDYTTPYEKSG